MKYAVFSVLFLSAFQVATVAQASDFSNQVKALAAPAVIDTPVVELPLRGGTNGNKINPSNTVIETKVYREAVSVHCAIWKTPSGVQVGVQAGC